MPPDNLSLTISEVSLLWAEMWREVLFGPAVFWPAVIWPAVLVADWLGTRRRRLPSGSQLSQLLNRFGIFQQCQKLRLRQMTAAGKTLEMFFGVTHNWTPRLVTVRSTLLALRWSPLGKRFPQFSSRKNPQRGTLGLERRRVQDSSEQVPLAPSNVHSGALRFF